MALMISCSQFHQHFTCALFSYKSKLSSFSLATNPKHSFVVFDAKVLCKTRTRKTFMKLKPVCPKSFWQKQIKQNQEYGTKCDTLATPSPLVAFVDNIPPAPREFHVLFEWPLNEGQATSVYKCHLIFMYHFYSMYKSIFPSQGGSFSFQT